MSSPRVRLFIEGRYRKLCRDLPQTVFFCPDCKGHPRRKRDCERCEGFGKLTKDSVQELIGWVIARAAGTRKHKFHGAGREDIDVRMLGGGRPFVFELVDPKNRDLDLAELEAEVNRRNEGRLELRGLHWSEKKRVVVIKESKHAKEYEARVEVDGELPREPDFLGRRITIQQQTPKRVAHRRADKVRERWVEYRSCEPVEGEPGVFALRVLTEHGTYVKEAVSGEAGNTNPSLGELLGGVDCRCVALDVLEIFDEEGGAPIESGGEDTVRFGAGLE